MSKVIEKRRKETLTSLLGVSELQGFSPVLQKVKQIADDPESDANKLAEVLSLDAGLTAKIMQLSNSAYYTVGRSRITTLRQAVVTLGFDAVKNLVMTTGIVEQLGKEEKDEEVFPLDRFWTHSIACALATPLLCERNKVPNSEEYFIVGFLHDIAKIVVAKHLPEKWEAIYRGIKNRQDPLRLERDHLGLSHAEIGAWLLRMWRFPQEYFMAVGTHHINGQGGGKIAKYLVQANLFAAYIVETFPTAPRNRRQIETQLLRAGYTMDEIEEIVGEIQKKIVDIAISMDLPIIDLLGLKEEKEKEDDDSDSEEEGEGEKKESSKE